MGVPPESFPMRALYFLILVLIVAAVAIFAYQNDDSVTLRYFNRSMTLPISLLIAAVYVLGMLSGWTVVGFLGRSWRRALERRQE
jgi:uncharacterized integral membrane protein